MAVNTLIKRANSETEYTPETMIELKKCKNDPIYFIQNYVKIQHPTNGTVPFDIFDYQKEIIDLIHNNKDSLVLASRQLGKCLTNSTLINIIKKPNMFKRFLIYLVDRNVYYKIRDM